MQQASDAGRTIQGGSLAVSTFASADPVIIGSTDVWRQTVGIDVLRQRLQGVRRPEAKATEARTTTTVVEHGLKAPDAEAVLAELFAEAAKKVVGHD